VFFFKNHINELKKSFLSINSSQIETLRSKISFLKQVFELRNELTTLLSQAIFQLTTSNVLYSSSNDKALIKRFLKRRLAIIGKNDKLVNYSLVEQISTSLENPWVTDKLEKQKFYF